MGLKDEICFPQARLAAVAAGLSCSRFAAVSCRQGGDNCACCAVHFAAVWLCRCRHQTLFAAHLIRSPHPPPLLRPPVQISAFFPGHHAKAMQQNAEMRKMEEEVQGLLAGRSLVCMSTGYA